MAFGHEGAICPRTLQRRLEENHPSICGVVVARDQAVPMQTENRHSHCGLFDAQRPREFGCGRSAPLEEEARFPPTDV
jgi:hypothetical protein